MGSGPAPHSTSQQGHTARGRGRELNDGARRESDSTGAGGGPDAGATERTGPAHVFRAGPGSDTGDGDSTGAGGVDSVASGNDSTASTAGRGWAAALLSWRRGRAAFRRGQWGLSFSRDQRGAVSFPADQGTEAELGRTISSRTEPKQTRWPDRSTEEGIARLAKRRGRREGHGCRSGTDERARACARERWRGRVCLFSLSLYRHGELEWSRGAAR